MRLIYSLTLMQLIYDIGLLFIPLYWVQALNTVTVFFSSFGGLATSLWSNVISLVVVYIVASMKTFDIEQRCVRVGGAGGRGACPLLRLCVCADGACGAGCVH